MSEAHGTGWVGVILCTTSSHRGHLLLLLQHPWGGAQGGYVPVPVLLQHQLSALGTAQTVIETATSPLTYSAAEH